MMEQGLYLLADDNVLDYFIALSNSLSINWPSHPPACVVPYSGEFGKTRAEASRREYRVLGENLCHKWQEIGLRFYRYPAVRKQMEAKGKPLDFRAGVFNRLAAFDEEAPFDRWIYLDVDTIVNAPLQFMLDGLENYDLLAHDYQWNSKGRHVFLDSSVVPDVRKTFCSGMFSSKKGMLPRGERQRLDIMMESDQQALYAFAPVNCWLNYAAQKLGWDIANLGSEPDASHDSQTYRKFDFHGNLLFDRGKRIHYFHNIGVPASSVSKVCKGKRSPMFRRYTNYFLDYRFATDPSRKPWRRGVYVVANDNVLDNFKALINSIRFYDEKVEICLIPYDSNYGESLRFAEANGGFLFPEPDIIAEVMDIAESALADVKYRHVRDKSRRLVNLACWFGPFDEFAYMDADIVVFRPMSDMLSYLDIGADFINYDRTYQKNQTRWIFTESIKDVFPADRLKKVFNSGFWLSRKGLFSLDQMSDVAKEVAKYPQHCDFGSGVVVQPLINWIVLDLIRDIDNLCMLRNFPEPWAGIRKMTESEGKLTDKEGKPLDFVHWAGKPIEEKFYSRTWSFYREMSA